MWRKLYPCRFVPVLEPNPGDATVCNPGHIREILSVVLPGKRRPFSMHYLATMKARCSVPYHTRPCHQGLVDSARCHMPYLSLLRKMSKIGFRRTDELKYKRPFDGAQP